MYVVDAHCHLPDGFTAKDLEFAFSLGFMDQTWALSAPLTHWTGRAIMTRHCSNWPATSPAG